MNKLVKEELEAMKYLLGYQRGKVISEQAQVTSATPAAAPQTVEDVIKQIQTTLNTKYGTKLTVDGKWGNLTQTAFETALKSKGTAPAPTTPAASGTTAPTTTTPAAAPAPVATVPTTTAAPAPAAAPTSLPTKAAPVASPAAENPEDVVGVETTAPTARDQRRERQDLRRSNRRAMQDLRTQQRTQ